MIDVLVLCYHAVSPTWRADLSVTPESIERQLSFLLGRGYVPTTFTRAVQAPPAARTLAVTFDDGYRSTHALAWPILRRLGVPATLFVPTALVGSDRPLAWPGIDGWLEGPDAAELAPCTWEEIAELRADGWEIGSHTRTHPHLSRLDDVRLAEELEHSRLELEERMAEPCPSIAYPFGDCDRRVATAAGRAGYAVAATLPRRFPRRPTPLMWPRLGVSHDDGLAAFRRRTSPAVRRMSASPLWPVVETVLPRARTAQQRIAGRRGASATPPPSPALRLLESRPRLATRRSVVLGAGVAARAGALQAYTIWPSPRHPLFIVEAGHRQGAAFILRTFDPGARPLARVDPAAWNVLRARALLLRADGGLAVAAAEHAVERRLRRPRVAAFSPSGAGTQKMTCFVFEEDADEPVVVVKAIADPAHGDRLRAETEIVERLRTLVSPAPRVHAALPLPPVFAGRCRGEFVLVEPLDPIAPGTGRADRSTAHEWLREFQAVTSSGTASWDDEDQRLALAAVEHAWRFAGRRNRGLERRLAAVMDEVRGAELRRCAVHGDFWRGNLAAIDGSLRVYDWEWARLDGRPVFDLWTYELAELRFRAAQEAVPASELEASAAEAVARVEADLAASGLDPRLARATLAPALAELSFRIRAATGRPGGNEAGAVRLMDAVTRLLAFG